MKFSQGEIVRFFYWGALRIGRLKTYDHYQKRNGKSGIEWNVEFHENKELVTQWIKAYRLKRVKLSEIEKELTHV